MRIPFGRPEIVREETIQKSGFVGYVDEKVIPKHNGDVLYTSMIKVVRDNRKIPTEVLDSLVPFLDDDDVIVIAKRKVSRRF